MRALALHEFSRIALYPILAIFVAELEYPLKVDAARRVKGPSVTLSRKTLTDIGLVSSKNFHRIQA
jgi:hypothetical protein